MIFGLVWITTALLVLILPSIFHGADKVVGGGVVIAFLWWLFVLRGRLARGEAGVRKFEDTLAAVSVELNEDVG